MLLWSCWQVSYSINYAAYIYPLLSVGLQIWLFIWPWRKWWMQSPLSLRSSKLPKVHELGMEFLYPFFFWKNSLFLPPIRVKYFSLYSIPLPPPRFFSPNKLMLKVNLNNRPYILCKNQLSAVSKQQPRFHSSNAAFIFEKCCSWLVCLLCSLSDGWC